ncbi:hypothetical protein PUNSTDRAFT_41556 [Punctularia strigosozonata HHB-11173 SS5]|uniref:uncharacterized protein n=1 Tax=Punctularia strigosozonata (strain HHB-11173) TaxID=741275 RepID=UPI00044167C9|nr:uncharacterized protein PUNSTDRAFT_41556 [Punctularia strigosozonata HHB-11173 SS5]EIN14302.1 hypothetical protein PUNSTDRAFT_41556 [Punctularia strigosozonata HHB-11173 SS5]
MDSSWTPSNVFRDPDSFMEPADDSDDDLYADAMDADIAYQSPLGQSVPVNMDVDAAPQGATSSDTAPIPIEIEAAQHQQAGGTLPMPELQAQPEELPTVIGPEQTKPSATAPTLDLMYSVKGLYRILDLINEQGSGGLVDKIIIAQDSLGCFINDISSGAYTSLTKVKFSALDQVHLQPIGVYGSKSEIVKFLRFKNVIDDSTATLLASVDDSATARPMLRSGLYFLRSQEANHPNKLYVIYWPEDSTWDDAAISSVSRNRITFMRYVQQAYRSLLGSRPLSYLTKIADQIVALISPHHAQDFVWRDRLPGTEAPPVELDDDESDRLFSFEVAKTFEQDEDVTARPGFTPRLLSGEASCGILSVEYVPPAHRKDVFVEKCNAFRLNQLIEHESIKLGDQLTDSSLVVLLENGLEKRSPKPCASLKKRLADLQEKKKTEIRDEVKSMQDDLHKDDAKLCSAISLSLIAVLAKKFPSLMRDDDAELDGTSVLANLDTWTGASTYQDFLNPIMERWPFIHRLLEDLPSDRALRSIASKTFKTNKERLLLLHLLLAEKPDVQSTSQWTSIVPTTIDGDFRLAMESLGPIPVSSGHGNEKSWWSKISKFGWPGATRSTNTFDIRRFAADVQDDIFLMELPRLVDLEPTLASMAADTIAEAQEFLRSKVADKSKTICARIRAQQENDLKDAIRAAANARHGEAVRGAYSIFRNNFKDRLIKDSDMKTMVIHDVSPQKLGWEHFEIRGEYRYTTDPVLQYTCYLFQLSQSDRHQLSFDALFIPSPQLHPRSALSFRLPVHHRILHIQLLQEMRCLLIVDDSKGGIHVYLEKLESLDKCVDRRAAKKTWHRDKIGGDFVIAFDETRRTLAVCGKKSPDLNLHIFIFDDKYTSLQGVGSMIKLQPWFDETTSISHMVYVLGSEELLFIDGLARARIFSLVTQQFRPASVQLPRDPTHVLSSPDGSCFIASELHDHKTIFRAYHWSTFGSTCGIQIEVPEFPPAGNHVMTSIGSKTSIHLVYMDVAGSCCKSVALHITRRVTEFMFQEKGAQQMQEGKSSITSHNCLVECHADVWKRFPVMPAVQRRTITPASSHRDYSQFLPHFKDLIADFERTTRKPGSAELNDVHISALDFDSFCTQELLSQSSFLTGEWLVDLICLIPIHIAVTKDNRFVPLKDGVWSAQLERSLLGATVDQIIDQIIVYLLVVVYGKQGVWLSATPTENEIIVTLDFEGVHSIERSAQEDTLLVLFNTAISNLVLFRNNFALSRDITGLFHSFQASSSVLDPSANPSLFQSMLVIIIKDVVDSDKKEITKEFSLKFRDIVQEEQGSNFISRLHAGHLTIVPWPVIESRQFYALFPAIKRMLDKQQTTHASGAIFLQTLKTLMAKLKVVILYTWFSYAIPSSSNFTENLAAHRVKLLGSVLPKALEYGANEIEPDIDPLRDLDSNMPIGAPDTQARFASLLPNSVNQAAERERILGRLRSSWDLYGTRQHAEDSDWLSQLNAYLEHTVDLRVQHVQAWLSTNTTRLPVADANVDSLRRSFDSMVIDLRASTQLCGIQCSTCSLYCLRLRHHTGDHDCQTSHQCIHTCQFVEECSNQEKCGLPYAMSLHILCTIPDIHQLSAGHSGRHVCDIKSHLCGRPCALSGRRGCLDHCSKVVNHDDGEHLCEARVHECGQPCSLIDVRAEDGSLHTCRETCRIPRRHAQFAANYAADFVLATTTYMVLMKMHNISADGICHIETAPQSIEATFTGTHQTFQYTKASNSLHERACPSGHTQQEHETSHGSMSRTRWTIDGQDGAAVELDGRKFGRSDEVWVAMFTLITVALDPVNVALAQNYSTSQRRCFRILAKPKTGLVIASFGGAWVSKVHDPYSREDQTHFGKWNPSVMKSAFHVSGSMSAGDRRPLSGTPVTANIASRCNNRLGAVYSALHAFWQSRHSIATGQGLAANINRRDSYTVVLFDHEVNSVLRNDFTSTPDVLLNTVLRHEARGGTNFTAALATAQAEMEASWSTERNPVIIFLSDGECNVADSAIRDLCRRAVVLGKALSFHAVSFGQDNGILRRMSQVATEVQNGAPQDPLHPHVPCSFAQALDSVSLSLGCVSNTRFTLVR